MKRASLEGADSNRAAYEKSIIRRSRFKKSSL